MKNKEFTSKEKRGGCFVLIAFAVVFALIITWCTSGNNNEKQTYTKLDAFVEVRQFVEQRLKSPGSAKWSSDYENEVTKVNDSTFLVKSWVDSQNSFGALIRTNFMCTLIYLPSIKQVRCENLIME